jgi:hypothetical protein
VPEVSGQFEASAALISIRTLHRGLSRQRDRHGRFAEDKYFAATRNRPSRSRLFNQSLVTVMNFTSLKLICEG